MLQNLGALLPFVTALLKRGTTAPDLEWFLKMSETSNISLSVRKSDNYTVDHTICDRHDVVIGYDQALQRRMQRARREKQPPIPQTVDDAEKLLREYPDCRYANRYKRVLC